MLKKMWNLILLKLLHRKTHRNLKNYWRVRAAKYGKRSVLNIAHGEDQFDNVTEHQKRLLFPLLKTELNGSEKLLLDFGCGPGRFTWGLAKLINGDVVGVDITSMLLELAPKSSHVTYQCIETNILPFPDSSFDVVWSCLVLGGIPDDNILQTIDEIKRVLKQGGLFFFIENTSSKKNTDYWFYRDEKDYIRLAKFCNPKALSYYEDLGEKITIFSGRAN